MERAKGELLIIEDDAPVRMFLSSNLKVRGYNVSMAKTADEGLELLALKAPDVIILDLSLPGMDGLTALRELRSWSKVAVIVLSARGDERTKIDALDLGADDYVTKPFSIEELIARVRAVTRRLENANSNDVGLALYNDGTLSVDLAARRVVFEGKEVALTRTEFELLRALVVNTGKLLTHRELLQTVWGPEYGDETEYLRTFIKQLRRKLEQDPASPSYIQTVAGFGYKFSLKN